LWRVVIDIVRPRVYYLKVASIQPKVISGKTYYYLVESGRVGGKPRIVSQRYLGSAEDIAAALDGATAAPARTRHLAFGDVAAVWGMLSRLGYAETVDAVVGSRRADAAASVGTYLALACANRVAAPRSKLAFVHIHKTGGLSIRSYLLKNVRDLAELQPCARMIGPLIQRPEQQVAVAVLLGRHAVRPDIQRRVGRTRDDVALVQEFAQQRIHK